MELIFYGGAVEESITILYEKDNALLKKHLVTLAAKCDREGVIELVPFSTAFEL